MRSPPSAAAAAGGASGSFTALLSLPTSAAMELLLPPSRLSEPALSSDAAEAADAGTDSPAPKGAKRKEPRGGAVKLPKAKPKRARGMAAVAEADEGTGGDQLHFVHVRARRGQATDSHSLAERARRERINARMELLKELVPGCSKVSGTALVLDEIINHVQFLQRQVEYLSMRLSAVNQTVDFGGIDSILAAERGRIAGVNCKIGLNLEQATWPNAGFQGARQFIQLHQQFWNDDIVEPRHLSSMWERHNDAHSHGLSNSSAASLFGYTLATTAPPMMSNAKPEP